MSEKGTRWRLDRDWGELPNSPNDGWSVPSGTTYIYLDTVDYFDWFQALVAFDVEVTTTTGRVLPAGTPLRTGYGIRKFSTQEAST